MIFVAIWLVVISIFAAPAIYIFGGAASSTFWDSVFSGLIGTASALIGGIPIALWVDRIIKSKDAEAISREAAQKEKGLLRLIKEEVEECKRVLTSRIATNTALVTIPIKSSFWQAASLGGKLNYISNHSLLGKISSTYYLINVVQDVEKLCFISLNSATVGYQDGSTAQRKLFEQCHSNYQPLLSSIDEVIPLIDSHIRVLSNSK